MKKTLILFFWMVSILLAGCVAVGGDTVLHKHAQLPAPPVMAAKSYILIDVDKKEILAQSNANALIEPASLTKLMSAYLVFEALENKQVKLDQTLKVSQRARVISGSRMFVEQGQDVSVLDLLQGMIVQSGNDATVVLAEGVGGSVEGFVKQMNDKAHDLGLAQTSYQNPEGLPATGHATTVRDIAVLSMRLIRDFPQQYKYYSIQSFMYNGIRQKNRNEMLFLDKSVDGLQTGHTSSAGYCLAASALRSVDGRPKRLLVVVVGAKSSDQRTQAAQNLLDWGYQMLKNERH